MAKLFKNPRISVKQSRINFTSLSFETRMTSFFSILGIMIYLLIEKGSNILFTIIPCSGQPSGEGQIYLDNKFLC